MKTLITWILVIVGIFGLCWFMVAHTEDYTMGGTCMEKLYTSDKNGRVEYLVIIRYDDGDAEEMTVSPGGYVSYNKGTHYFFKRQRFTWDKK